MALKELQIRNIRPTDKVTHCTGERGLYLEVHPNGSKLWRGLSQSRQFSRSTFLARIFVGALSKPSLFLSLR